MSKTTVPAFAFSFWEGLSLQLASLGQAACTSMGDWKVRRAGGGKSWQSQQWGAMGSPHPIGGGARCQGGMGPVVCHVLGGLQRGKREGWCQMTRPVSPEPNDCKYSSLLRGVWATGDCMWECQHRAAFSGCGCALSSSSLYIYIEFKGREGQQRTAACENVGKAARCYMVDIPPIWGSCECSGFGTKHFARLGLGSAAGNVMSCLQPLAPFS